MSVLDGFFLVLGAAVFALAIAAVAARFVDTGYEDRWLDEWEEEHESE